MSSLDERIEAEIENIEKTLDALPARPSSCELSPLEIAGTAALIHNFYNGVENMLKQIVSARGHTLPNGASWHRELIQLATSAGVIGRSTGEKLKPYLAFRHFFVHAYALDLSHERVAPLAQKVREVFGSFREDLGI